MISFIIPTYNEEKVIAETLQRLRKFTLAPYEIIVADDQSTDRTVEIAKNFADKVVIVKNKTTIAANRNHGAKEAQYPFLVFIDSGVEIPDLSTFFRIALKRFEDNTKLYALAVRVHIHPIIVTKTDILFTWFLDAWFSFSNNIMHWGLSTGKFQMIRTEAFKKIGGYNESLAAGEDNELYNRLSAHGHTRWEKRLTVFHLGRREHALGWPQLLVIWALNGLWVTLFNRSFNKEWRAIR